MTKERKIGDRSGPKLGKNFTKNFISVAGVLRL